MADKDLVEKKLEDHNDVFADILNTLLFGKNVLQAEGLQSSPTESIYKADNGRLQEQRRDTQKDYRDGASFIIAAFGIENQSGYDRTMPVRILGYDSAGYKAQLEDKCRSLHPVITIVLNFSDRRWGKVKSLRDLMDKIPQELEPYFQDYRINVFDVAFLPDGVIESFQSDFKVVARIFKNRRLGRMALMDDTALDYPAEIAELLSIFLGDTRYREAVPAVNAAKQKGERVTMCWMLQELIDKGERRGEERGEKIGEKIGEKRLATLLQRLMADGRSEAVLEAISSEQARGALYLEYGLVE